MSYANNLRAEMIYLKCLRAGKIKWAENIKSKYKITGRQCDVTDALFLAMVYREKRGEL